MLEWKCSKCGNTVPKGKKLSKEEVNYIVKVIVTWINKENLMN